MNPAANGASSVGLGAAITIIVNAWLQRFGYPALSADESAAYIAVIGSAISYYLHLRGVDPNFRMFRKSAPAAN